MNGLTIFIDLSSGVWNQAFNILVLVILGMTIPLMLAGIYRLISNPSIKARIELIKDEYEKQLEVLRKENDRLRKLIDEKEKLHRKQLEDAMYRSKMALSLSEAISAGAVKVLCPVHDTDVQVLVDGTLVCTEGHRIVVSRRPEIPFETGEEYEE